MTEVDTAAQGLYLAFYGFAERPFTITPDPRYLFLSGRHAEALAAVVTDAGRQFNRGQRAFFFALAYVGWFVSPAMLALTTAFALVAMLQRQFYSPSHEAVKRLVAEDTNTERPSP